MHVEVSIYLKVQCAEVSSSFSSFLAARMQENQQIMQTKCLSVGKLLWCTFKLYLKNKHHCRICRKGQWCVHSGTVNTSYSFQFPHSGTPRNVGMARWGHWKSCSDTQNQKLYLNLRNSIIVCKLVANYVSMTPFTPGINMWSESHVIWVRKTAC